jgi:hypothetical protein
MSEEVSLDTIIRSVRDLKKVAELREISERVIGVADDIESFMFKRYEHFAVRLRGYVTTDKMEVEVLGDWLSINMTVPADSTLVNILDRFFEEREFIKNALAELADSVKRLAERVFDIVWEAERRDP